MQTYVALVSVFYQFISLASELTCVGQLIQILSPEASAVAVVVGVAVVTNIYTLVGGLRASLATDVWQGVGVLLLVLVVCFAMMFVVHLPPHAWSESKIAAFTPTGFETLVTLCIAVTASNLFFTGFWQRVYSANDDATLRKACLYCCFIIIPFTVALAVSGMVSELVYPGDIYFFSILLHMRKFWQVLVAVVITSLASSVSDSIQIGIAAELVSNFPKLPLSAARVVCRTSSSKGLLYSASLADVVCSLFEW